MIVQNALMNAYGYVTRCLGSGPGVKNGIDGHHGMNEIWLNKVIAIIAIDFMVFPFVKKLSVSPVNLQAAELVHPRRLAPAGRPVGASSSLIMKV